MLERGPSYRDPINSKPGSSVIKVIQVISFVGQRYHDMRMFQMYAPD